MMDPVPSLNVAYAKVVSDERKQTVSNDQDTRSESVVGFAASGLAHDRSAHQNGDDAKVCDHCGRKGHKKERCFELHGWPEWSSGGRGGNRGGRSGHGGARGGRSGRHSSGGGRGFAANMSSSHGN